MIAASGYFDQANSQNCYKANRLPAEGIELELTADQVFGWLKMEASHFSQIMTVAHSYGWVIKDTLTGRT